MQSTRNLFHRQTGKERSLPNLLINLPPDFFLFSTPPKAQRCQDRLVLGHQSLFRNHKENASCLSLSGHFSGVSLYIQLSNLEIRGRKKGLKRRGGGRRRKYLFSLSLSILEWSGHAWIVTVTFGGGGGERTTWFKRHSARYPTRQKTPIITS